MGELPSLQAHMADENVLPRTCGILDTVDHCGEYGEAEERLLSSGLLVVPPRVTLADLVAQMLAHHFLTVSLLSASYLLNYTRIGNVILILMDPSDVLLAVAKNLKYTGFENACTVAFGVFMLEWLVARHWYYNKVYLSVLFDVDKYISNDWSWEREHFFTPRMKYAFVGLLSALQILLIMWFAMIIKVAVGVVIHKTASDARSDSER